MPERVVVSLEVIDVEHRYGQRRRAPNGGTERAAQLLVEAPAVGQPCQGVRVRFALKDLGAPDERDVHADRLHDEHAEHRIGRDERLEPGRVPGDRERLVGEGRECAVEQHGAAGHPESEVDQGNGPAPHGPGNDGCRRRDDERGHRKGPQPDVLDGDSARGEGGACDRDEGCDRDADRPAYGEAAPGGSGRDGAECPEGRDRGEERDARREPQERCR